VTPGARVEAAIGLLAEIDRGGGPADDTVANYFRRHRFAGVKDRQAISGHIYAVLRHRAQLDWWIARTGKDLPIDARKRVLIALKLVEQWPDDEMKRAFDGDRFRPMTISNEEQAMLAGLPPSEMRHKEMPPEVAGNYPAWLGPHLEAALGKDLPREMRALNEPAALDLRANLLKADRDTAWMALKQENIEAAQTPLSPLGLRVFERIPLGTLETFKSGLIEVQDEGSQLAALLADARPGMRVVDFCAGAGGKTLTLVAAMNNRGHLVACDVSAKRLERATERLRRAGASIVQRVHLSTERDKWVKKHVGGFDRVFVDAPCTGTGTWRRNPDAKWRLKPKDLEELAALQAEILDSAQRLVKGGGRLIYATCSLLREEDESQIEQFLETHPDFSLKPIGEVWREVFESEPPHRSHTLRLSPARDGTDGFFVAVMERKLAPKPEPREDASP
jgi:16S rRNA (cytosine967-C5)-methyltransferase